MAAVLFLSASWRTPGLLGESGVSAVASLRSVLFWIEQGPRGPQPSREENPDLGWWCADVGLMVGLTPVTLMPAVGQNKGVGGLVGL